MFLFPLELVIPLKSQILADFLEELGRFDLASSLRVGMFQLSCLDWLDSDGRVGCDGCGHGEGYGNSSGNGRDDNWDMGSWSGRGDDGGGGYGGGGGYSDGLGSGGAGSAGGYGSGNVYYN